MLRVRGGVHALAGTADRGRGDAQQHVGAAQCARAAVRGAADGRARDVRILGREQQGAPRRLEPGESRHHTRRVATEICICKCSILNCRCMN